VADVDGSLTFGADTQTVRSYCPPGESEHADATRIGIPAARAQILSQVNSGQLLVKYMGHGSGRKLGRRVCSRKSDAATFTTGTALPVFLIMDCLTLLPGGVQHEAGRKVCCSARMADAVAVWSSSG